MRSLLIFPALVVSSLAACADDPPCGPPYAGGCEGGGGPGVATSAAIVGGACVTVADCAPLNADCIGGVCKGGDGDPCTMSASPFDPAPCLDGFACAACDVATFGAWECACADPWATPPTGCAPSVCLPMVDACNVAGCAWDPVTQACGCAP